MGTPTPPSTSAPVSSSSSSATSSTSRSRFAGSGSASSRKYLVVTIAVVVVACALYFGMLKNDDLAGGAGGRSSGSSGGARDNGLSNGLRNVEGISALFASSSTDASSSSLATSNLDGRRHEEQLARMYKPDCVLSSINDFDGGCKLNAWYTRPRRLQRTSPPEASSSKRQQSKQQMSSPDIADDGTEDDSSAASVGRSDGLNEIREFTCGARKSDLDSLFSSSSETTPSSSETILNFKKHTSWMFDKWYDFKAECAKNAFSSSTDPRFTTHTDGQFMARHLENQQYKIDNFCVKPMGLISGYFGPKPRVSPFQGTHEAFKINKIAGDVERGTHDFLAPRNIETLASKPDCFLNNKVLLVPITDHTDNPAHVFHRTGSILRYIEEAFPPSSLSQASPGGNTSSSTSQQKNDDDNDDGGVLIIYVVTDRGFPISGSPRRNSRFNFHKYFYDITGTSWLSIFARPNVEARVAWYTGEAGSSSSRSNTKIAKHFRDTKVLDTPICFRQGFVWHNAHQKTAQSDYFNANHDWPGHRFSFHIFGERSQRDVETLKLMNEKLRNCPSPPLPARRTLAKATSPHVIFLTRSIDRKFSLQPLMVSMIAEYVKTEWKSASSSAAAGSSGATFEVLDESELDFEEIILRFSKADVLIGMMGVGLQWLEFMPPGAVVVEFNGGNMRCARIPGVNANDHCDFGGAAVAAQVFHVAIATAFEPMNRWATEREVQAALAADDDYYRHFEKRSSPHRKGGTPPPPLRTYNPNNFPDLVVGPVLLRFALDKAKCLLERGAAFNKANSSSSSASPSTLQFPLKVPEECQFVGKRLEFESVIQTDVNDYDGTVLAGFVQMNLPALSPAVAKKIGTLKAGDDDSGVGRGGGMIVGANNNNNININNAAPPVFATTGDDVSLSRMKMMIRHKKVLSSLVAPFRVLAGQQHQPPPAPPAPGQKPAAQPSTQPPPSARSLLRMLIIVPCSAKSSSIIREVTAWRGILKNVYRVVIAEYAEGVENCGGARSASDARLRQQQLTASGSSTSSSSIARKSHSSSSSSNKTTTSKSAGGSIKDFGVVTCRYPCSSPKPFHIVIRSLTKDTRPRLEKLFSAARSFNKKYMAIRDKVATDGVLITFDENNVTMPIKAESGTGDGGTQIFDPKIVRNNIFAGAAPKARYGGRDVEPLITDLAKLGFDPNNFYGPLCHLSTENLFDGGCKLNPWYRPGRNTKAPRVREFTCPARKSQRERLRLEEDWTDFVETTSSGGTKPLTTPTSTVRSPSRAPQQQSNDAADTAAEAKSSPSEIQRRRLLNWKRHTSWMFDKWYDWEGECVAPDTDGSGGNAPPPETRVPSPVTPAPPTKPSSTSSSNTSSSSPPKNGIWNTAAFRRNNDGQIRGAHGPEGLYSIENFCLKPMGRLQGFWSAGRPHAGLGEFQGVHEAGKVNGAMTSHTGDNGIREWLMDKNIERLASPPACFYKNKVIFLPLTVHSGNVGHLWHRNGGLLRTIEVAFGKQTRDQLDDLLVIYVVTNRGYGYTSTPEANENMNVQKFFYDIVGTAWASVFAENVAQVRESWKFDLLRGESKDDDDDDDVSNTSSSSSSSDSSPQARKKTKKTTKKYKWNPHALDTPICFRQAFVYHNAHHSIIKADTFIAKDAPNHRTAFSLFGHRSMRDVETLNTLFERMAQCPAPRLSPRRKQANRINPHVVFMVRSGYRRFNLQPHLVNVMADYVSKELNGTFEVVEHIGLDFDEVIEKFSKTDILIGMLGAGLIWLELMPPGGIIIELNSPGYRCAVHSGINKNPTCDFGGAAAGAQLWHIAVANTYEPQLRFPPNYATILGNDVQLRHGGGHQDSGMGGVMARWALTKAKCLFEYGVFDPQMVIQRVPPACQFDGNRATEAARRDVDDASGESLAAFVQMQLPPASASSSGSAQATYHPKFFTTPATVVSSGNVNISNQTFSSTTTSTPMTTHGFSLFPSSHSSPDNADGNPDSNDQHHQHQHLSSSSATAPFHYDSDHDPSLLRMKLMIHHRKALAQSLHNFRSIGADRGHVIHLHLLVPCAANATSVVSEVAAWRGILRDVYKVYVGEYFDGVDNCPAPPTEPEELPPSMHEKSWLGIHVCRFPCAIPHQFHIVVRSTRGGGGGGGGGGAPEKDPAAVRRALLELYVKNTVGMLFTFNPWMGNITAAMISNQDVPAGISGTQKAVYWREL